MSAVTLQPETHLGTYRLIGKLGQGGMGEVWKAEDTRLGRTVAIKILPHAIADDAQAIARMKREARTAAQIYHPNIATIHAFEELGDRMFIVMEFVDGEPLTQLIRRGPVAEGDVCRIGRAIADALAEAHEKGIIHRDIKPDNVIVNGPRVKVLDFGIAKRVEQENIGENDPTTVLTQQGMIIGTVFYMSPEQALGKTLDARSDLFSLGAVLFEMATGRKPFHGDSATETITKIVRDEAPLPQGVSRGLGSIIARCMRKDPAQRFASARELSHALDAQLDAAPTAPMTGRTERVSAAPTVITASQPQPAPPSRTWLWIAAIVFVAIASALAAFVISQSQKQPAQQAAAATTSEAPAQTATTAVQVTAPTTTEAPVIVETAAPVPAPIVTTTTQAPAPPPPPEPVPAERTADDDYNEGVSRLVSRQALRARESFEAAIAKDPHHARAHFRLGEIALFLREFPLARRELNAALADADRLEPREKKLTELGLAVLNRDRNTAEQLIQEITAMNPRDPDLQTFRELLRDQPQRPPFRRGRIRPQ